MRHTTDPTIIRKNMKITKNLALLLGGALAFAGQEAAAISLDINSSDVAVGTPASGMIHFSGTAGPDTFNFVNAANGFSFTVAGGNGLGSISGLYTIGPVTTSGGLQTAPVTGGGVLTIDDNGAAAGGGILTATVNWMEIFTFGTGGGLNAGGVVNLTGITYTGSRPDLLALSASPLGSANIEFGFNPAVSLLQLTATGADFSSTFTGDLVSVPDGGNTVVLMGSALLGIALLGRRFLATA